MMARNALNSAVKSVGLYPKPIQVFILLKLNISVPIATTPSSSGKKAKCFLFTNATMISALLIWSPERNLTSKKNS